MERYMENAESHCKSYPHCYGCNAFRNPTNADRIRHMSDEELATHLHDIGWDCHLCAEHGRLDNEPLLRGEKCDEKCVEHCLEWLQQPSKLGTGGLTMAKYIDREALVEWLKRIPLKDLSDGLGLCRVIMEDDFKKAIKQMPKGIIADVAPVRHGRWVLQLRRI